MCGYGYIEVMFLHLPLQHGSNDKPWIRPLYFNVMNEHGISILIPHTKLNIHMMICVIRLIDLVNRLTLYSFKLLRVNTKSQKPATLFIIRRTPHYIKEIMCFVIVTIIFLEQCGMAITQHGLATLLHILRAGLEYGQEVYQPVKNFKSDTRLFETTVGMAHKMGREGGGFVKKEHLKSEFSGQVSPLWV